jgi:hypothetical protein
MRRIDTIQTLVCSCQLKSLLLVREETYNQPTDRMKTRTIFWRRMSCRRHKARTGNAAIMRSVTVFKVPFA